MTGRYAAGGSEAEYEPGSGGTVLRNRLHITDEAQMEIEESRALVAAIDAMIEDLSPDQRFTAEDIRVMHRAWLGGIYRWAGEYRSVQVSKGFTFADARFIPTLMGEYEAGPLTRFTPCRRGDPSAVATALAVTHGELILIHPFREGNGRCARILATLMGTQAGLPPLVFDRLDADGERYYAAIRASLTPDYEPLTDLFVGIIEDTLAEGEDR